MIFTTIYTDYTVENYKLNATDYLFKPIHFDSFVEAVNKVQILNDNISKRDTKEMIILKSSNKIF